MEKKLGVIEENGVIFFNVPMEDSKEYGCGFTLFHRLIIEHYTKTNKQLPNEVDFSKVLYFYKDMNTMDILSLLQNPQIH